MTDNKTDSRLINQAQGIARNLSYNDKATGAAKHMLLELSHRLGARTVHIHKKTDGYLMVTLFGSARFLTLRESVLWRWFSIAPAGMKVEHKKGGAA